MELDIKVRGSVVISPALPALPAVLRREPDPKYPGTDAHITTEVHPYVPGTVEHWNDSWCETTVGGHTIRLAYNKTRETFELSSPFSPPRYYESWVMGFQAWLQETRAVVANLIDRALADEIPVARKNAEEKLAAYKADAYLTRSAE